MVINKEKIIIWILVITAGNRALPEKIMRKVEKAR
jgi:hypothetical protein